MRPSTPFRVFALRGTVLLVALCAVACGGGSSTSLPVAPPRTVVYTAIGASDAVGIGAFPLSRGYVPRLAEHLQGLPATVTLDNLGINGAHADDMVEAELPAAIASDPDVVTVWTGSNDLIAGVSVDAFGAELDVLLGDLSTKTNALVFVADLVDLPSAPRFRQDPDPDVTAARVAAYNAVIAAAAEAHGCVLVQLSDTPLTDDLFSIDGFHPNNDGYAVLADRFWQEMRPRL